MKFEAKFDKHGVLHVACNAEKKKDGSVVMHAPSLPLISKLVKEAKDGKRDIRTV